MDENERVSFLTFLYFNIISLASQMREKKYMFSLEIKYISKYNS